jgi:hypothetical protein
MSFGKSRKGKKKLNLIIFQFDENSRLIAEVQKYYKGDESISCVVTDNIADAIKILKEDGQGLFLFNMAAKQHLQSAVMVLKNFKKFTKKGLLKPACITDIKNKKVDKILAKYGCTEVLDPYIKPKSLTYKIDFWSRSLDKILEKQEVEEEIKQSQQKAREAKKDEGKKKEDFVTEKALSLQSDIWIINQKSDCKKVLRRWLIRALGPSPHVGTWVELEPQPGDKLPTWKYVFKDERQGENFVSEEGAWFFYGIET